MQHSAQSAGGRSARLVEELAARDGEACVWCGREPWPGSASVDHICPRSRGGTGVAENLVIACRACNRARRSKGAAANLRACREAGLRPREEVMRAALERLAGSERRAHREYAEQQLRHLPAAGVSLAASPRGRKPAQSGR